jgi:hypothetical protein
VKADPRPPCGPWLLLGADPGLKVRSDQPMRAAGPTITFTAGADRLVEKGFVEPEK